MPRVVAGERGDAQELALARWLGSATSKGRGSFWSGADGWRLGDTSRMRRPLTYYVDPSSYNELSHQPGRPDIVARLVRAREAGQAFTYMGRYVLHEIALTLQGRNRDKAPAMMRLVRDLCVQGRLIRDTPELLRREVAKLANRTVNAEALEEPSTVASVRMTRAVNYLASGVPASSDVQRWVDRLASEQRRRQDEWSGAWRQWIAVRSQIQPQVADLTAADYINGLRKQGDLWKNIAGLLRSELLRTVSARELARRIDETRCVRAFVYYFSAAFYHQVLRGDHAIRSGDVFDYQHGLAAGAFDVFVCSDRRAREYAAPGCRARQHVMTPEQLVALLDSGRFHLSPALRWKAH